MSSATAGDADPKHSVPCRASALRAAVRSGVPCGLRPSRPAARSGWNWRTFVGAAFKRKHDATVTSYLPTLLSFRDPAGALRGVVGLRGAGAQPLYLEQYLEQPVEAAIAAATGRSVCRRSRSSRSATWPAPTAARPCAWSRCCPRILLARDYRWIVFTATSAVRGILLGFGAPLVELARADARARGECRRTRGAATTIRIRACSPASFPTAGASRASAHAAHDH